MSRVSYKAIEVYAIDSLERIFLKYDKYVDCINIEIFNRTESADINLVKKSAIKLRDYLNEFIEDNNEYYNIDTGS